MSKTVFTPEELEVVSEGVQAVWNIIASDASELDPDNYVAVELCLDANRMTQFGYPDADEIVHRKIDEGYSISGIYEEVGARNKLVF